jgi:peptidoglycan/LPS O-acetylase OafA/YrhL
MRVFGGIQAMRGVAALSIACAHILDSRPHAVIDPSTARIVSSFLQAGVDVFFVISGFIIASTAAEIGAAKGRTGAFSFALKRFARIYPLYWIVLTASVISTHWIEIDVLDYGKSLTFDYVMLNSRSNYFVPVAWTLWFEVWFYAAMSLAIFLAPNHVMKIAIASVCALGLLDAAPVPQLLGVFSSPLTLEFGFGIIVAVLIQHGLRRGGGACLLIGAVAFATGTLLQIYGQPFTEVVRVMTFGAGAALCIYAIVVSELRGAMFPPAMQYLGDISYSLYIWHVLILAWLKPVAATSPWLYKVYIRAVNLIPGLESLILFVVILATAMASYEFIERPLQRVVRRLVDRPSVAGLSSEQDIQEALTKRFQSYYVARDYMRRRMGIKK